MAKPRLESIIDTQAPVLARVRKRLAFATGVLLGAALVIAMVSMHGRGPIARPRTVLIPTPVVFTIPTPAPAAPSEPPPDPLACPVVAGDDLPIGAAVRDLVKRDVDETWRREEEDARRRLDVVAAAQAPVLAIHDRVSLGVLVSADDGRTFDGAFDVHVVQQIAIAPDGVVYARSESELGVREPGGRERWRAGPFPACEGDPCNDHIAVAGGRVVWFHDSAIATSRDHGKTWRVVAEDSAWDPPIAGARPDVYTRSGAVYRVEHYVSDCGIDDKHVWRLDRGTVDHAIFHRHGGSPVLVASDDAATTWTWRRRCMTDDPTGMGRCDPASNALDRALVEAGTLRPIEGARTLAVHDGGLIELCALGARLVYRSFPFWRIDAVDWRGRPVVVDDNTVLRWSPIHGWRRLHQRPESDC